MRWWLVSGAAVVGAALGVLSLAVVRALGRASVEMLEHQREDRGWWGPERTASEPTLPE